VIERDSRLKTTHDTEWAKPTKSKGIPSVHSITANSSTAKNIKYTQPDQGISPSAIKKRRDAIKVRDKMNKQKK